MYQFTLLRIVTPAYFLMRDGFARQRDNFNCLVLKQGFNENVRNREEILGAHVVFHRLFILLLLCCFKILILLKGCSILILGHWLSLERTAARRFKKLHGARASGIITPKPVVQWLLVLLWFRVPKLWLLSINQRFVQQIYWFSHYDWRNSLA